MKCEWFLKCENESIGVVEHPVIGDVEICQRCFDWLDDNPTKWVPPLAAKHGRKLQAIMAELLHGNR